MQLGTAGLPLRPTPWIFQPFLLPQLQCPLLDEVNGKVLGGRNDVTALRVPDPTENHLHVVYLILLLFFKSWTAPLRIQMPLKLVHTSSSPSTARVGTKNPTREMGRLDVSV